MNTKRSAHSEMVKQKKPPKGGLVTITQSLSRPALNLVRAMLSFSSFQPLVTPRFVSTISQV
jgi:hypothetical protein